jgi:hypothetical protein
VDAGGIGAGIVVDGVDVVGAGVSDGRRSQPATASRVSDAAMAAKTGRNPVMVVVLWKVGEET